MLFESLLMLVAVGLAIFMVGIPLIKLVKALVPSKRDSLKEAKVRLEVAHKDVEAARLNKETDKLYQQMYEEISEEDSKESKDKLRI